MDDFLNDISCDGINVCFDPEETEKGLPLKLVETLMNFNFDLKYDHFDIIVTSDDYCTIVRAARSGKKSERDAMFVNIDDIVLTDHGDYYTHKGDDDGEKFKLISFDDDPNCPVEDMIYEVED